MFLGFGWSRFASTINHTICFEEFLYLFIFISAVALDDGMYDAIVLDFGIVVEFEDDAVRKFSSLGRSEQIKLQRRSGSIGMVRSTRYTDVARFTASLSMILPSVT